MKSDDVEVKGHSAGGDVLERLPTEATRNELIAPEKSEYRHGTHIRHLWYCSNCETSFESLESIPVEAMTTDNIFPSSVIVNESWRPSGYRHLCCPSRVRRRVFKVT